MSGSLLYLASEWIIRFVMLFYVPQRRTPAASRTWLLLIFLLPWPGLILYWVFGRIYVPEYRRKQQQMASQRIREVQSRAEPPDGPPAVPAHLLSAIKLAEKLGDFQMARGNAFELLSDYQTAVDRLVADIGEAEHHVHLLYYIFESDRIGQQVAKALEKAAQRGVHCRVLMDAVGSKNGLRHLRHRLKAAGVEVQVMLPVGLFRGKSARFDLRNHRKIGVIDGKIGYLGSQNLVEPDFVLGFANEELVTRVRGPVVAQLQAVFLTDYHAETGHLPDLDHLFPPLDKTGDSSAQLLPSGPSFQRSNLQELLVALLHAAKTRVVMVTPYFVPDEPFLQAIRTALDRGVTVHLILSKHSNQRLTNLAQKSYYDDLLEMGVQLHHYRPRFLHAKHLTIDESVAVIGSTNLDIRSFALNAEVSLLIYDPAMVQELGALQKKYFEESELMSLGEWRRRPVWKRVFQDIARLADSLL
jgi:cardiolipin synthase